MGHPHSGIGHSFVIRRLDTSDSNVNPQIPHNVSMSYCFLYLCAGELLADLGTEPFLVEAGDFLMIPPGVPFSIKYYDGTLGYMGAFSPEVLRNPHLLLLHRRSPALIDVPVQERPLMDALTGKLLRDYDSGTGGESSPLLYPVLDLMLGMLEGFSGNSGEHPRNGLCHKFLDCVFDRAVPVSGVSFYAGKLGVSANHLNRVVKAETGRSAGAWIDISRLALAKLLLRRTALPVIDIASETGFDDQSYFSRFFKKHTGQTPSEFRNV